MAGDVLQLWNGFLINSYTI